MAFKSNHIWLHGWKTARFSAICIIRCLFRRSKSSKMESWYYFRSIKGWSRKCWESGWWISLIAIMGFLRPAWKYLLQFLRMAWSELYQESCGSKQCGPFKNCTIIYSDISKYCSLMRIPVLKKILKIFLFSKRISERLTTKKGFLKFQS